MGILIFVGAISFIVAAGLVGASAIIHTTKPRLSAEQIKRILVKYHDEYGEFNCDACANDIEERLTP